MIGPHDPHFEIRRGHRTAQIHVDIEVRTLGSVLATVNDLSAYHEIDVVIVPPGTWGRPNPDQLLLGIECKAVANFDKAFVREVLGRRRELSLLQGPEPCPLDGTVDVPADPASEYWLAYIDPAGDNYRESPHVFGVEFKWWAP